MCPVCHGIKPGSQVYQRGDEVCILPQFYQWSEDHLLNTAVEFSDNACGVVENQFIDKTAHWVYVKTENGTIPVQFIEKYGGSNSYAVETTKGLE